MAKGHVGRPTNEEVAARKRKQLLKVLVPCILIGVIAVMIITQTGLKGLMGNSTKVCEPCEEGWQDGDGDTCYQETKQTSQTSAYLLGDADNNGIVNGADYELVEAVTTKETTYGSVASNTSVDLDERQEAVYDINQDGAVDYNDVIAFNEYFSSSATAGKILKEEYEPSYVCPKEKVEQTTDDNNQTITTTTTYAPDTNNKQVCNVTTTVRTTKDKKCYFKEENKEQCVIIDGVKECYDKEWKVDCKTVNGTQVCGEDIPDAIDNVEDDDEYLNDDEKSDVIDESEYLDESDAIDNVEDDDEDDNNLAIYEIRSNYLKYLANSKCTKANKCLEFVDNVGYPIVGSYLLLLYPNYDSTAQICQGKAIRTKLDILPSVANVTFNNKRNINIVYEQYDKTMNIDQLNSIKCIKILKYDNDKGTHIDGTSSINIYANSIADMDKVSIVDKKTTTKESSIQVNYSFVDKFNVNGKTSATSKTYVELPNEYALSKNTDGYSFAGWIIKRTRNKKTEVLCYKDSNKKQLTWEKVTESDPYCNVAPKVIGSKKNVKKDVSNYVSQNSSYNLTFVSRWTKKQPIKVQFQNKQGQNYTSKNKSSLKNVSLKLFKYKNQCINNKGAIITKKSQKKTSYTFKKTLASNQYYYLRVASTKATVRKADQCQRITLKKHGKKRTVKVRFDAAIYKITYKLDGGKNNTLNPKNYTKKTKTFTLKQASKKGYTFKGWYTKKSGGTKITKIKKGSTGNITLYAHWRKK